MTGLEVQLRGRRESFELDVDITLPAHGVTALFGRSGSGKTTLLRCLAGLESLPGSIRLCGSVWQDGERHIPPERRRVGYVFQEAALLPHLSVLGNLEYGFRRASEHRIGIDEVTHWLGLEHLLERRPHQLSGGEQQRVAIARALAHNPTLLLMDEPLAALDAPARNSILAYLEQLPNALEIPLIYVTHASDEVARLADRVVWLEQGRVAGVSTPEEFFAQLEVGAFLGEDAATLVPARVSHHDQRYHLSELTSAWGPLFVQRLSAAVGSEVRVSVRAKDISIALAEERNTSILNVFRARVAATQSLGPAEALVRLECPADRKLAVLARVTQKSLEQLGLTPGLLVYARVKGVSVR